MTEEIQQTAQTRESNAAQGGLAGMYCVGICTGRGDRPGAFVLVRLGAEDEDSIAGDMIHEYEPLLALDLEDGRVLMRFNWEGVREDGDDRWAAEFSERARLGLFEDFETAYFYAHGLIRRAA